MGIEENKSKVQGYVEDILNNQNYDKYEDYFADDFVGEGGNILGKEGHIQSFKNRRLRMPDLHFENKDMIAEGNRVFALQQISGTMNSGSTKGKYAEWLVANIYEFRDGKIIAGGARVSDSLGLLQQLGVLPSGEAIQKKME